MVMVPKPYFVQFGILFIIIGRYSMRGMWIGQG